MLRCVVLCGAVLTRPRRACLLAAKEVTEAAAAACAPWAPAKQHHCLLSEAATACRLTLALLLPLLQPPHLL